MSKLTHQSLIKLTKRDLAIFQKLNVGGWLTTQQLRDYFFKDKSRNAVCKRLRKLVAENYVAMARISSTESALYRLAGQGKLALIKHQECAEEDITIPTQLPRKLRHFTRVNDLRLYFEREAEAGSIQLPFFFSERELCRYYHKPWLVSDFMLPLLSKYKIIPDAVAKIRIDRDGPARELDLLIEYDEGTEHAAFFGRTKIKQYAALVTRHRESAGDVKVLTFARSVKRIVSLMRQTVFYQPPPRLFYFASIEMLNQNGWTDAEIFLDPDDYFDVVRRGSHIEVLEREIRQGDIPKHALKSLPSTSPRNGSRREESRELITSDD